MKSLILILLFITSTAVSASTIPAVLANFSRGTTGANCAHIGFTPDKQSVYFAFYNNESEYRAKTIAIPFGDEREYGELFVDQFKVSLVGSQSILKAVMFEPLMTSNYPFGEGFKKIGMKKYEIEAVNDSLVLSYLSVKTYKREKLPFLDSINKEWKLVESYKCDPNNL